MKNIFFLLIANTDEDFFWLPTAFKINEAASLSIVKQRDNKTCITLINEMPLFTLEIGSILYKNLCIALRFNKKVPEIQRLVYNESEILREEV
ncbi:hypothetical protein [Chryseobacterium taichungense]|uniref:hypothetical protein n=1 Tax=Chryseobacterium taichungense TaxID=295069 RepID=UPI0028AF638D|nr:hypothetical protein [Chryseobacterium taichungense]